MAQSREEENKKRRERYAANKLMNGGVPAPRNLQQGAVSGSDEDPRPSPTSPEYPAWNTRNREKLRLKLAGVNSLNPPMPGSLEAKRQEFVRKPWDTSSPSMQPTPIPSSAISSPAVARTIYDDFLDDFKSRTSSVVSWAPNTHGRVLSIYDPRSKQAINTSVNLNTSSPLGPIPIVGGKESDGQIITQGAAYQHVFNQWKTQEGETGFRIETGTNELAKAVELSFLRAGTKGYRGKTAQDVFGGISADMIRRDEEHLSAASRAGLRVPQGAQDRLFGTVRYNLSSPGDRFYGGQGAVEDLNSMIYGGTTPSYLDEKSVPSAVYNKDIAEQNRLKRVLQEKGATFNNGSLVLGQGNYLTYAGGIPEHISPLGIGVTGTKKLNQATGSQVELMALEAMRGKGGTITGYRQAMPQPIVDEANKPIYGIPNIQRPGEERTPAFLSRIAFVETGLAGGAFFQGAGKRVDAHGRTDSAITKDMESMSPLDLAKADIKFTGKHAGFGHGRYDIATVNGETVSTPKMREEFYPNAGLQTIEIPALRQGNKWSQDPNKGESTDVLAQELRDKGHLVKQVFGLEFPRLVQEGTTLNSYRVKGSMGALKGTLTPTGAQLDNDADMIGFEMKNARGLEGIWGAMTNKEQRGLTEIWAEGEGERGQRVLSDLDAQIGGESGIGISTEQLATTGRYRGGSVEFLSSVFKTVSASKGDAAAQQRIARAAGFSYKQSGVYDLGPWSKEHYRAARSDYVTAQTAKGMNTREALRQFNKTYTYGKKGSEKNILQMNVNYPHLVAMTAHSRVGDPSSSGNLSGLFLNEITRKYPEFAKNITGRGMTNDQMAGAGLLRYAMDQTDASRGMAVSARVVNDSEAEQIRAINAGRKAGSELKGAEYAKAVADIVPDVGIGDTMDVNGALFPSPLAIAGKQFQTEENEFGPANKWQRALGENIEEQLLPEEERIAQRRYAAENDQQTKAQWTANDMFRDINRSKETLIKDLKSVKTAGASWSASFFAPWLGRFQQSSGRALIKEDARAIARQTGAKFKDVFSSLTKGVTGLLSMRQIAITPGSEVPTKLALGGLGISGERERIIGRDLSDQFDKRATGDAAVRTDTKDWDLDPESIMRRFVNAGKGVVKFGQGLALHGQDAVNRLREAAGEMFTPKLQRELISSQKAMSDAIGQPDIVEKIVNKATRLPTTEALQKTSDSGGTGMTSANAWYMTSADVGVNAVLRGEEVTRARTAAFYDIGIDMAEKGNSDLASMFSSARVTTDEQGNLRLNYSTSRKVSEDSQVRQTNQLALGGKGTENAGIFGVRQFVRKMAVDATTPFNGEVMATPEHIANMFSRNKNEEKQLLATLKNTDRSQWGKLLSGKNGIINESYANQFGDDAKRVDAEWLQAPGPASLIAIAIRKNRSGDVANDQDPSVIVPNGVQKFVTSLAEMVSGGNNEQSQGMVERFNRIAKHLVLSRNEKGIAGEGNKLGTNDLQDLMESPAGGIANAERLAMERVGIIPGGRPGTTGQLGFDEQGNARIEHRKRHVNMNAMMVTEGGTVYGGGEGKDYGHPSVRTANVPPTNPRTSTFNPKPDWFDEKNQPVAAIETPQVPNVTGATSVKDKSVIDAENAQIPGVRTPASPNDRRKIRHYGVDGKEITGYTDFQDMADAFAAGQSGAASSTGGGWGRNRTPNLAEGFGRPSVKQRNLTTFNDRQLTMAQNRFTGKFASRNAMAQEGMDNIVTRLGELGIVIPQAGGRNNMGAIPAILRGMLESGDPDKVSQARSLIAENENRIKAGQLVEETAANAIFAESHPSGNATVDPIMESSGYFTSAAYQRDLALGAINEMAIPGPKRNREAILEKRLKEGQGRSAQLAAQLTMGGLIGADIGTPDEWKSRVAQVPKEVMSEIDLIAKRTKSGLTQKLDVSQEQKQLLDFALEAKRVSPELFKAEKEGRMAFDDKAIARLDNAFDRLNKTTAKLAENSERLEKGQTGLNDKQVKALQVQQRQAELDIRGEGLKSHLATGRARYMDLVQRQVAGERLSLDEEKEQTGWAAKEKTMQGQLGEIAGEKEELTGKNQWGKFARKMLGGFGLMYLRSIYGLATQGWGYGQQEAQQMEQIGAQGAYGATNIANVPYNQAQQVINARALGGSLVNPQLNIEKYLAKNAPLRDIKNVGAAGIGTWGLLQYAGGELGGAAGAAITSAALPVAVGVAGLMAISEIDARSNDPTGLGQRLGRTAGSLSGTPGIFDMAAMGWTALTDKNKASKAFDNYAQTNAMERGYLGGQSVGDIFKLNPITFGGSEFDKFNAIYQSTINNNPNLSPEAASQAAQFAMRTQGMRGQDITTMANEFQMGGKNVQAGMALATLAGNGTGYAQEQVTATVGKGAYKVPGFETRLTGPAPLGLKYEAGKDYGNKEAYFNGERIEKRNPDGTWTLPDGTIVDDNAMTKADPNAQISGERAYVWGELATEAANRRLVTPQQAEAFGTATGVLTSLPPRAREAIGIGKEPTTPEEIAAIIDKFGSSMLDWTDQMKKNYAEIATTTAQMNPEQMKKYGVSILTPEEYGAMSSQERRGADLASQSALQANQKAQQGIISLSSQARYYGNNKLADLTASQMDGMSGGMQDFYTRARNADPMAMATLAQGGVNLGSLANLTNIQGNSINANYTAFTDVNENGQLTGMQWGSSTLKYGSMSAQEVGANIFGPNPSRFAQAAINGYKLPNPIDTGMKDKEGNPIQMTQVSGQQAIQWTLEDTMYQYQQQGFGLQQQSMNLGWAHTQAGWKMQDKQIALSNWYQQQQFGLQQEQINQSAANIQTGNAIQQKQMTMTRAWAKEDWAYQDQTRNMQWGWKQEDFAEESRFMTGRQRKLAERQMGRETTMHNLEGDQIDKTRARQEELWKLEDDRFALQKKQQSESLEMQQKQLDLQKKYFEEQKKLQAEQIKEERKYQKEQQKIQQEQLNLQIKQAEATRQAALDMRSLQLFTQGVTGEMNTLTGEGMQMFEASLTRILDKIRQIYDITTNAPSSTPTNANGSGNPTPQQAQNFPYGRNQTAPVKYEQSDTSYFLKSSRSERPQTINLYIGNQHLSKFVLDAVTEELRH